MNELYILSRQNSRSNRADFSWSSCCLFLDQSPRNKRWQIPIRSYLVHHSGANLRSFSCLCENFFLLSFAGESCVMPGRALKLPSFYCALWSLVYGQLCALGFLFLHRFQDYCSQQYLYPLQLQSFLIVGTTLTGSFSTTSYLYQKFSFFKLLPVGSCGIVLRRYIWQKHWTHMLASSN